ncbi:hypothetical protein QCA50_021086 [Cerrena zonata]|uniref:Uncharacterized protein n=1 Tax=Cerrena zonata TaxID=2478898 RepID=A0AAW0F6W7_9APHY
MSGPIYPPPSTILDILIINDAEFWQWFLENHLEDIKYMYGHIKAYLDCSHNIASAPDGDKALEDCKRRFQI